MTGQMHWEIPSVLEIEERRSLCKMRCRLVRHQSTLTISGKTMSGIQGETVLCDRADALGNTQCIIDGEHKVTRADDAWDGCWGRGIEEDSLVYPLLIFTSTGIQQKTGKESCLCSLYVFYLAFYCIYLNISSFFEILLVLFYFIHGQL